MFKNLLYSPASRPTEAKYHIHRNMHYERQIQSRGKQQQIICHVSDELSKIY